MDRTSIKILRRKYIQNSPEDHHNKIKRVQKGRKVEEIFREGIKISGEFKSGDLLRQFDICIRASIIIFPINNRKYSHGNKKFK